MLKKFKIPKLLSILLLCVTPLCSFFLLESMTHSVRETMNIRIIVLNLLFYYLVYGALWILSKRSQISLCLGTFFFMISGLVNYYVIEFRSVPLYPWDFLSLNTALSVSKNYDYELEPEMMYVLLGFLLLILVGMWTRVPLKFKQRKQHVLVSVFAFFMIYAYSAIVQLPTVHQAVGFYEYLFTPNSFYRKNGFMLSFISNMQYLEVDVPDGYDVEELQNTFEPYMEKEPENSGKKPNIIVIMNEAFSDPSVLGNFETNMDYMPYIHSMSENTIKGTARVSVKGGNTANSEFEFLTGNSMAFLPYGSIPYQQYINGALPSVASQLKGLGYETYAMHPYGATGWNRNKVYPYFGFDTCFFKESFQGMPVLREYTTDLATYEKIVQLYKEKPKDQPMFVFDVTMQNHSSYSKTYENFVPDIEVYGSEKDQLLERYLSLIKVSDQSFGALVEYFKKQEEPTLILMFGDHQPADWVVRPIYAMQGIYDDSEWSESVERYEVPYVLWSNFDMDFDMDEEWTSYLSLNYLSTLMFKAAGLSMSPFQKFMYDLSQTYPVISANIMDESQEALRMYWMMNYNYLFDDEERNPLWYE